MSNVMTEDLDPNRRLAMRYGLARGAGTLQLSTTIVAVALFALTLIAVSIGIAQAETLSAMVEDETGRLALFGLVVVVILLGGITGAVMWRTAPSPRRWSRLTEV
jgi:hypothetical protein